MVTRIGIGTLPGIQDSKRADQAGFLLFGDIVILLEVDALKRGEPLADRLPQRLTGRCLHLHGTIATKVVMQQLLDAPTA